MYGIAYHAQLKNNAPHLYVYLEDDSVSIIEMNSLDDFKKGDIISGNLDMFESDIFINHSQQFKFSGYVQFLNAPAPRQAHQLQTLLSNYLQREGR